ncbi:MAG: NAD(P)-dependent oxidoreductase [Rhizobiales bacterium]|nr:NAD(P)-dependent oxidoreductase [Hyphomicrobiales bacterium]NRB14789.1 NAD(P)-dependent oxidoreductase [Hyphomicrobiales bacterium]
MSEINVSFLGLGVMGYHMAGYLAKAGHNVTVYNRSFDKAEKWVKEFGGKAVKTPALAAKNADFIFACVGNDDDLRSITIGENGAFETIKEAAIFVDNTTVSAAVTRELFVIARAKGAAFIDAPVSGGEAGAINGKLTVMCGGNKDAFAKAEPIIANFAQKVKYLGASGAGQLTKMVNQICIAGILQGLSEGINFAQKVGLDVEDVIETISKGAAQSWQMENRYKTMNKDDYDLGFAVDWMVKDMDIVLNTAKSFNIAMPMSATITEYYRDVQNMGGNRWDTSSLLKRLQKFDQ